VTPRRAVRGVLGAAGLLALAEVAGRTGLLDPEVLPLASTVLGKVFTLPTESEFLTAVWTSLMIWATGIAIATAIAIPIGGLIGVVPLVDRLTRPVLELLRPIPPVAVIPLALISLGSTTRTSITVVAFAASWPVLIHTVQGMRDADPVAVETLHTFGFGRLAVLRHVVLPSAAPFIATGVRVAAGIALIVTVTSELFAGGGEGIGTWLLSTGAAGGETSVILAAVAWAGLLGLTADALLSAAARRLFHWHPSFRTARTA
jgi:NitT/TauT family transport system permease protein